MKSAFRICIWLVLSGALALAQSNPVPFVNQPVLPTSIAPGGPGFTLTVNGSGFVSGATVNWNGSPRNTTFVSVTQLTAAILSSDITNPTTAIVTVTNPTPGASISNYVYLSVVNPIAGVALVRTDSIIGTNNRGGISSIYLGGNLLTGDFNGDGRLDIAAGEGFVQEVLGGSGSSPSICVYLGAGTGLSQTPKCYAAPIQYIAAPFPSGSSPCLVTAADVNGDGKIDLLCTTSSQFANPPNAITVFLGNGDGTFQTNGKTTAYDNLEAIAGVGDFNHDGKVDLVALDSGATTLLLGNGDGTFAAPATISSDNSSATIGDFNRDGNLDVVVTDATTSLTQILLGNGDATFQAPVTINTLWGALSAEDLNNDSNLDFVVLQPGGGSSGTQAYLSPFLGEGDGTFQGAPSRGLGTGAYGAPVFGDMNGDGKLDFVGFMNGGTSDLLSLLFGNGDGTFQGGAEPTFPAPSGSQAALGDFNGDGKMDVVAFTASTSTFYLSTFIQGTFPIANLAPNTLNFNEVALGGNASQPVILTNTGNVTMSVSGISFTGTNAGEFSQTNNCGTSLVANASCTINVTFTSAGGGALTAALAVSDNAAGSPQTVSIAAISPDFSMSTNTSPSVTVSPGQSATYGITIASVENFAGTVTLSCGGGPPGSTCTVVPGSASVNQPVTATVTVSTAPSAGGMTERASFPPYDSLRFLSFGLIVLIASSLLIRSIGSSQEPRIARVGLMAICLIAGLAMPSCGGNGGGGSGADTYAVTVKGTFTAGAVTVTHNTKLTLILN